jgi:hypothetical protein
MNKKNELKPVDVPWMVSPSVSCLMIVVNENKGAIVSFNASILPPGSNSCEELLNKRVEVHFISGQWVRISPAYSDIYTIPPNHFDRENIDSLITTDVEDPDYFIRFRELWTKSGKCPNPNFYKVRNSEWLIGSGADRFGCEHYVLDGRDMWLEILCRLISWKWSNLDENQVSE